VAKKKEKVLVAIVLDMSGSMTGIRDATIDMVNEYINGQKEADYKTYLSLTMFDQEYMPIYTNKDISKVEKITRKEYSPRGTTALLDAVGRTVIDIDNSPDVPKKVIIAVVTDGMENASKDFTKERLEKLIKEKESLGWSFIYLSSSLSAFADAQQYGFSPGATLSYTPDAVGIRGSGQSMSAYTMAVASVGTTDKLPTWEALGYKDTVDSKE
jgi:hypothetical protein